MMGDRLLMYLGCGLVLLGLILAFTACTTQPSCLDNPRNMRCMSADQLKKELSK